MSPHPPEGGTSSGRVQRLVTHCRAFRDHIDALIEIIDDAPDASLSSTDLEDAVEELRGFTADFGQRLKPWSLLSRGDDERPAYLEGTAWTVSVPELVGFLASSNKSGVLWVSTESERFVIVLDEGKLAHAVSDRTPQGARIGELLAKQGALREEDIGDLVERARAEGTSLGTHLVRSGRVSSHDVEAALRTQVQELFGRLLDAPEAIYRFQEGDELVRIDPLELNVAKVLLESARLVDERRRAVVLG